MFKVEFRAMTKTEGYRWFLALGEVHAREDGKPYLFFGIMIDITAKREYDQALQKEIEANERLQEALYHEKKEREIIDSIASIYNTIHLTGLKRINDSLGHAAGDELLQGTAQCLLVSFGPNALVYRTGGDEFMVMLESSKEEVQKKLLSLDTNTAAYKGKYVDGIVLAKGVVCRYEFPRESIWELEKIADQRMYADKSLYYESHRIEKRR